MQTKLFVFFAFLAFCHVSYCDTAVTSGPTPVPDDVQKMLQHFQHGLTTAVDAIRTNLGKVFSADAVFNLTNSLIKNTSLSAQQVQEIVQKTFQVVQENIKSTMDKVNVPDLPNVSQVGDAVVKTVEIIPAALKNVFSFLENVSHGTNNQASNEAPGTVSPHK